MFLDELLRSLHSDSCLLALSPDESFGILRVLVSVSDSSDPGSSSGLACRMAWGDFNLWV